MTRDELIEVMDEALHTRLADDGDTKDLMRAVLKAIEDAGLVVAPKEPNDAMLEVAEDEMDLSRQHGCTICAADVWEWMIKTGRIE